MGNLQGLGLGCLFQRFHVLLGHTTRLEAPEPAFRAPGFRVDTGIVSPLPCSGSAAQPSSLLSPPSVGLLWPPLWVPAYDGRGSYRLLSIGSLTSLPLGETLRSLPNVTAWAGCLDPQLSRGETVARGGLSLKVQLS